MKNLPVLIIIHFYVLFFLNQYITTVFSSTPPYKPDDDIALDCGSSTNRTALDRRVWIGDEHSKFAPTQENIDSNYASTALSQTSSVEEVPYMTARIFRSPFTYSFPVTPGPKFVRLYFYPAQYWGFDSTKAYFKVTANSFTLLNNFSANLVAKSLKQDSFMREFCVNVVEPNQRLNLTFLQSSSSSSTVDNSSYAFVNGIEIVSMPDDLYYGAEEGMDLPIFVGHPTTFEITNSLALETIWRMNMGGSAISAMKDTGMYRKWSQHQLEYLMIDAFIPRNVTKPLKYSKIRNYTAPDDVYRSALTMGNNITKNSHHNLTWRLPVVKGFNYLVRLHFCEFEELITKVNDRRFSIYLGNQTAQNTFDIIEYAGGNSIPFYRDYVVNINNEDFLFIDLGPDGKYSRYVDAILNGLEVFKISTSSNLAGPNPEIIPETNQPQPVSTTEKSKKKKTTLFIALGCAIGFFVIILCMVSWVVFWRSRKTKYSYDPYKKSNKSRSSLPQELCRRFSLSEIKTATKDFDQDLMIGRGGFGNVYKGFIDDASTLVAVKRLNPGSNQGAHEFITEIEMLSQLRYVHLVSLIGYCDEEGEMILVYEYVANGTLQNYLYGSKNNDPLTWNQRLEICIGAARGLNYLHAGVKDTIIHRDVKTTNILLDENWVAKVSDFGLSRIGQSGTEVSTAVKGTFGYLDPEYARSQHLTDKSDVYSFGVVLLEVLCGRKPLDLKLGQAQWNLAHWAQKCIMDGTVQNIIDPFLMGKIAPECFKKFVEVAESCVREQRIQRPTMGDVMENLEFALVLQKQADAAAKEGIDPDGVYYYPEVSFHVSDKHVPGYNMPGLQSGTSLGSNSTGLSFLSGDNESGTGDMFSETTNNSKSTL